MISLSTEKTHKLDFLNEIQGFFLTGRPKLQALAFIALFENITDRKQAEDDLQKSEERFRATFEQAAVVIAHVSLIGKKALEVFLDINRRGRSADE